MAAKTAAVLGIGVVGAAVSYELAQRGFEVYAIDRNPRVGEGVTSRNSGVIHAGLYYPPTSLKAQSCIRGNALLYEWCQIHDVPHRKTGKWIVAQADEKADLEALYQNAMASGCKGLRWLTAPELSVLASQGVNAASALFSSETGIVDAYAYTRSFVVAASALGSEFLLQTEISGLQRMSDRWSVETSRGVIEVDLVFNCGGLYADELSARAGFAAPQIYPWRGDYFRISDPSAAYPSLVYPVKKKGAAGLGVHLTQDLNGQFRLGPDVALAQSKEDFGDPRADLTAKRDRFFASASRYLPALKLEQLSYDTCGIRPKLRSPSATEDPDFVLSQEIPGFVQLIGIESPGLTAAIDLAQRAVRLAASNAP